ncbi:MAG: peptide chain release factor N(5)-glutamine methyltransferase [Melioribacteraceae bacterium]|nr:peptide chain release factor N(5)-glutamine methyltransferase [Melioribacteraceae bacterium]
MLTVLEAINLSTSYLEKKNIESPRLNAELLLANILTCKRIDLYLSFDRPLKENEIIKYRDFIRRRGNNEPLQYILGKVEFYNLEFMVNNSVLIPRPETEILVEEIISVNKSKSNLKILDIGTGSGIIPICLAKNLTNPILTAIDISVEAIEVAKQNAINNHVDEKISFINEDINKFNIENDSFDIIVSNPPYISVNEYQTLQNEVKNYEPKIALTDNNDGVTFYKLIIDKSIKWLKPNGYLFFELGYNQRKVVEFLMNENFNQIKIVKDFQNIDRVIYGVKK